MSETRYPGHLTWADTRRVAAVLRAARKASEKRQEDVAAELGWSRCKANQAENAVTRLTPADALAFAGAVGVSAAELGLEAVA
jgi:transcriptional regulator with XRE-family HTH domain